MDILTDADLWKPSSLLFALDRISGFFWHGRHFLLFFIFIPTLFISLSKRDNSYLSYYIRSFFVSHRHIYKIFNIYISCVSEQMCSWEVKVTYGRHGDSVVWVIVLHRLCFTDDRVFQVIFCVHCERGQEGTGVDRNKENRSWWLEFQNKDKQRICSSNSPRASLLSFSIFMYSLCRWK